MGGVDIDNVVGHPPYVYLNAEDAAIVVTGTLLRKDIPIGAEEDSHPAVGRCLMGEGGP